MTTMEERAAGFERKFAFDQEQQFKLHAKRDKLLGLWVANRLGMNEESAQRYAREVVKTDLSEAGHEDVVRKILADVRGRDCSITEQEIRAKLNEFYVQVCEAHLSS